MKFSSSMASMILALIIVLTAVAPAEASYAAAKEFVKVEFQNKTGSQVSLVLSGPHSYYYYLNTGKTKVEIIPGKYTFSYTACGQTKTGKFNAKNDGATLTLPKCSEEKEGKESKVTFKNNTGASFYLTLTGPKTYWIYLPSGTTKTTVIPGKYQYSYTACDKTNTGKLNAKGNASLALPKCEEGKNSGESQVTFKNNTGSSLYIYLTGPKSYTFYLPTGTTKTTVISGKYKYSYQACGQTKTGNLNAKNSENLALAKCKEEKSSGLSKITIKNNTGGSLTIYLTGPKSYTFYFSSGTSKIEVAAGKYSYTAYGCGGASISGTKNFKGNDTWTFWCY